MTKHKQITMENLTPQELKKCLNELINADNIAYERGMHTEKQEKENDLRRRMIAYCNERILKNK